MRGVTQFPLPVGVLDPHRLPQPPQTEILLYVTPTSSGSLSDCVQAAHSHWKWELHSESYFTRLIFPILSILSKKLLLFFALHTALHSSDSVKTTSWAMLGKVRRRVELSASHSR